MLKLKAFAMAQKGTTLYLAVMTTEQLLSVSTVDRWAPSAGSAYQRPEVKRRYGEIARYIRQEDGILPTSILLSARPESTLVFQPDNGTSETVTSGTLTIGGQSKLWVIDGQHRIGGLREAAAGGGPYAQFPVPVTILKCRDEYTEMRIFNVVNTRQKPIPKDIVDQHLRKMREVEGPDMQKTTSVREFRQGRAAEIVEILNGLPGPWFQQVRIPGVPERQGGILRGHSLVVSLEPILDNPLIRGLEDQELGSLLCRYWKAFAEQMKNAFLYPEDHTVQKQVGIYALHRLFPSVLKICTEVRDSSQQMMGQIIKYVRLPSGKSVIDSKAWHKIHGDHDTQDTRMQAMRGLAEYMKHHLPPPGRLKSGR